MLGLWLFVTVVFTALHGMQTRSSDENFVCPFVGLLIGTDLDDLE